MAEKVTQIIDQEYESIISSFKSEALPMLHNNLRQLNYTVTGSLRDSLDISIHKKPDGWQVDLTMFLYGKVLEKKEVFAYNASAKDLAEWIRAKGLENFSYTPGYESSSQLPDDAAERIAWAIKMSDQRYRFGNPGTATTTYSAGRVSSRRQNAINRSWLYRPYFGLWAKKRDEFIQTYYTTTSEDLIREITKTYKQAAHAPNIMDTIKRDLGVT